MNNSDLLDVELSAEERKVIAFLASTRRVDVRWLNDEERRVIRSVLDELHNKETFTAANLKGGREIVY